MENVEGVTAEETTVEESVENQAPDVAESKEEAEPKGEEESKEPETVELSDEEIAQLESDPKVRAYLKKKTGAQKNALRHSQEAIEKRNEVIEQKDTAISELQKRIAELETKEVSEVNLEDFDTDEEYEKALRRQELREELRNEKLDDAKVELNALAQEKINLSKQAFEEQERAFIAENPEYHDNTKVVQEYLDMVDKNDPGFQAFGQYLAFECENSPALLNHLGANPEKIEALLGKPPALIKRKLQGYMKDLAPAPKEPPAPLPEPPKKAKGTATPKRTLDDAESVLDALGLRA